MVVIAGESQGVLSLQERQQLVAGHGSLRFQAMDSSWLESSGWEIQGKRETYFVIQSML